MVEQTNQPEIKEVKKPKRNKIMMCLVLFMSILLIGLMLELYFYRAQIMQDPLIYGIKSLAKSNGLNFSCSCDAIKGLEKVGDFQFDNFGYKKSRDPVLNLSQMNDLPIK
jgi:hypothetical protein